MRRIHIPIFLLAIAGVFICPGCGKIKGPDFGYMESPRTIVATPASPASGDVTVTYQLIDRELELGTIVLEYSTDNGQTFNSCTLVNPGAATNLESAWHPGKTHSVQWDSVVDNLALSGDATVCVKVTPSDASNPSGTPGISGSFTVNNIAYNQPPTATVATPAGIQSGNIQINYFLSDAESNTCSIEVLYSTNDGTSWQAATMGPAGDGTSGLSSSPAGTAHVYLWDSRADNVALSAQVDTIRIRIIPTDFNAGTAGDTNSFSVDNSITNDLPTVTITSGPLDGSTVNTTQVTFGWSGSDTDGMVTGYYYSFNHDPPDVWTTDTSVTSGVLSEDSHVFRVVAVDDQYDLSAVASRTFTVAQPVIETIYVATTGNDTTGDGSPGSPYATIQKGLDSVAAGCTVLVLDGTYTGAGNKNLDFAGKAIHLKSAGGAANCIIDCENSGRGFYFHSGETNAAIIEGFTIQNGRVIDDVGGGIKCYDGASPTIKECVIRDCRSESSGPSGGGGGICCYLVCTAQIINCIIEGNHADLNGGGISCLHNGSSPVIANCLILNNNSDIGGGIHCTNSSPTITNCTIVGNSASSEGGGISSYYADASPTVNNTALWNNNAASGNEIYVETDAAVTLNYCDYANGSGDVEGGGTVTANNSITLDPLFVNAGAGDYHLQSGSPCIDAGDNTLIPGGVTTDLDGNERIYNVTVDIGAYEYGAGRSWTLRSPADKPPARDYHAMAYDSARGVTVLFGGYGATGSLDDTWEWNGNNWADVSPGGTPGVDYPSAKDCHAMAYDSNRGVVVLFGGDPGAFSDETWEWDGADWTRKLTTDQPSGRYHHAMAYDSNRGVVVLFGGDTLTGTSDETWEWDGTDWTQKFPGSKPPKRYCHRMAYDSTRETVVLFGGVDEGVPLDDTWEWDGTNWAQKFPADKPSPRSVHAMAYDSVRAAVILFGGDVAAPGYSDETWEWNGNNWTNVSPAGTPGVDYPTARLNHATVFDSARGVVVLFGGYDGSRCDDTWEY